MPAKQTHSALSRGLQHHTAPRNRLLQVPIVLKILRDAVRVSIFLSVMKSDSQEKAKLAIHVVR